MTILKKLFLSSEHAYRRKPYNQKKSDEFLFKREFIKKLPNVSPILRKNSYIPPCGKLFNGISLNLFQFNTKVGIKGLVKTYLKSLFFLIKIRKITRIENILYITNSNSHNFYHWFLDVLQKLEFIYQSRDEISNSKIKIVIPNGHENRFSKRSLKAFNLNFYYQKKNEIIVSSQSILLPDIAPTGNFRKKLVLKLSSRMREYWKNKKKISPSKKRIYISRNNSNKRKLINEKDILPILKNYGFIILDFDQINFEKQVEYILNSEIIVSTHGAGLTHMLWMKKRGKILEIRAKDNKFDNCYFSLASDLGHEYFYVLAEKTNAKDSNHLSDLVINAKKFSSELVKMI